jgi:hypothetical protein
LNLGANLDYLPIGSVVVLKNGTKKLMIYGRKQMQSGIKKIWDYVACLYPEGNLSEKYNVFFNHFEIDNVLFKGYEDDEELVTREALKKL